MLFELQQIWYCFLIVSCIDSMDLDSDTWSSIKGVVSVSRDINTCCVCVVSSTKQLNFLISCCLHIYIYIYIFYHYFRVQTWNQFQTKDLIGLLLHLLLLPPSRRLQQIWIIMKTTFGFEALDLHFLIMKSQCISLMNQ